MNAVKDFLHKNTAPMLLSTAVISSAAYIYSQDEEFYTAAFTVFSAVYVLVMFALFELLKRKKKTVLSIAAITLLGVGTGQLAGILAEGSVGETAIWFMEPSRYNEVFPGRIAALILVLGFVLTAALYYFTRVRSRTAFVFLICMCPFCLFAKTFTAIPVIYPVIITTLFFFIVIADSARLDGGESVMSGFYPVLAAFLIPVTAAASFFPKIEYAPYREQFDEFISGVSIGAAGKADFSEFTASSSSTTSDDETRIYDIYGDNPGLIKRQCFNRFEPSSGLWTYYGDSQSGNSGWRSYCMFEDNTALRKAVGAEPEPGDAEEKTCEIVCADSGSHIRAVYTCENILDLDMHGYDGKVYRTELDEYFIPYNSDTFPRSYEMIWQDCPVDQDFAEEFDDELAEDYSDERIVMSYINAKEQAVSHNDLLLSETERKRCYSSEEAWERVSRLTQEITASAKNDYQKAKAIEAYLKYTDYIYDDSFLTADSSPDNFIFRTKRGACTAYATAMTLMCREAGLTARYVEGFMVTKADEEKGCMYVTAEDAHAFTQVWIDGYGWTDFDAVSEESDEQQTDMTFVIVGGISLLAAAAGLFVIYAMPRIKESLFIGRAKRLSGMAQAALIYERINSAVNRSLGRKTNTFTPEETARHCFELSGADITAFTADYERMVYGGYDDGSDNLPVYLAFTRALKEKRAREKKERRKN